jgi:hypothetical protein
MIKSPPRAGIILCEMFMRFLIAAVLLLFSATAHAQGFDTTYLYLGKRVSRDLAKEYRVVSRVPKNGLFSVRTFDLQGRMMFEGKSGYKDSMVYEGQGLIMHLVRERKAKGFM